MLLFIYPCHIYRKEVTVVNMICRFPQNHWYIKPHWLFGSISPLSQRFYTCLGNNIRNPWFALVSQLYSKISVINFSYKVCYRLSVVYSFVFKTNVTKAIRMIFAGSWCHLSIKLKNNTNHLNDPFNPSSKHRHHEWIHLI